MLRQYYRVLFLLMGDLLGNLGPIVDKADNEVGLLNDFASGVDGTTKPRAIWAMGRDFVQGQASGAGAHAGFVEGLFGASLRSGDYRAFAANANDVVDLTPNSPIATDGSRYSVVSNCFIDNDVLNAVGVLGSAMAAKYADSSTETNPKIASVYAPSTYPAAGHEAVTLVEGFRLGSMGTWNTLTSHGRILYLNNVITNLFAGLNCTLAAGGPVSVGENPNNALINFLALRSENPHRGGNAQITFGITRKERVELKVYDVTGRLVKTLANREFAAGEHNIFWDGTSEDGQLVARGVYFYQLRTPSFVSQKKLAVLKH
jgi:hypothetical protein